MYPSHPGQGQRGQGYCYPAASPPYAQTNPGGMIPRNFVPQLRLSQNISQHQPFETTMNPHSPAFLSTITGINNVPMINSFSAPVDVTSSSLQQMSIHSPNPQDDEVAAKYLEIERQLSSDLQGVIRKMECEEFDGKVKDCLLDPYEEYVKEYCGRKKILFVGMNPGPNGAGKNGIPFGDEDWVRDWLHIDITEYESERKEESGSRFWSLMATLCERANVFFHNSFVMNYCPLLFLDSNGDNIALKGLDKEYKTEIEKICDDRLRQCIDLIQPEIVVAIGDYVYKRLDSVLCEPVRVEEKEVGKIYHSQRGVIVAKILHPSPKTGHSEVKWKKKVEEQMSKLPIPVRGNSLLDILQNSRGDSV